MDGCLSAFSPAKQVIGVNNEHRSPRPVTLTTSQVANSRDKEVLVERLDSTCLSSLCYTREVVGQVQRRLCDCFNLAWYSAGDVFEICHVGFLQSICYSMMQRTDIEGVDTHFEIAKSITSRIMLVMIWIGLVIRSDCFRYQASDPEIRACRPDFPLQTTSTSTP